MKKKRIIVAVLVVLLFCWGMAGCGGKGSDAEGDITITLMTISGSDKAYFDELGDKFHKENPNITIKVVKSPEDDFDTKLQTTIASKTGPDIFTHAHIAGYMDFYSKGMLTDLTPYMEKYEFDGEALGIEKDVMDSVKIDGKTYGIPLNVYTSVLFYNKDLFDKAGVSYPPADYEDKSWTYDEMMKKARAVVKGSGDDNVYGLLWRWGGESPLQDPEYFAGKQLFNMDEDSGFAVSSNITDPAIVKAFQEIADMSKGRAALSPKQAVAMTGGDNDADPFLTGKVGMSVGGAWILYDVPDMPFKVGVAAIPTGKNPKERCVLYTDPYVISKDCEHPDEAFQFLQFMAQPENQKIAVTDGEGNPPASQEALEEYYDYFSEGLDRSDLEKVITGGLKYGVEDVEHLVPGSGQIHDLLLNELDALYEGKEKAAEACKRIEAKLDKLLKEIADNK